MPSLRLPESQEYFMPDKRLVRRSRKGKAAPNNAKFSQDNYSHRSSLLRGGSTLLPLQMSQTGKFNPVREEDDDEIVAYGEMKKTLGSVGQPKRNRMIQPLKVTI